MALLRVIPRLDIKGPNLIKGVQLEGLRVLGDPREYACKYYESGADELLFMDGVASLYGRNNMHELLKSFSQNLFIPITVGGGIRSVGDVHDLLSSGADKVAINTAAVRRPGLITEVAQRYGSQAMVLSVEAKSNGMSCWEVYTDNGRERTGLDVLEWVAEGVARGAGEILVTSVDREGTRSGFDVELIRAVVSRVSVPVIMSGGMGTIEHFVDVCKSTEVAGISMAHVLHYNEITIGQIKKMASSENLRVRTP